MFNRDYPRAKKIVDFVCRLMSLSYEDIISKRNRQVFTARGVICLYCYDKLIHPETLCEILKCTRCNIINVARKYFGYYRGGDKEILKYMAMIKDVGL